MAGIKESPRQRMIGMMYLVLTALLALQVSSAIIEKFIVLNENIEQSNAITGFYNGEKVKSIEDAVGKRGKRKDELALAIKARAVHSQANQVISHINELKKELIQKSGGYDEEGKLIGAKEETEVEVLMVGSEVQKGKAYELKRQLNEYVQKVNKDFGTNYKPLALDAKDDEVYKKQLDQKNKDFAQVNFAQTPLAAALAVLSELETNVLAIENKVLVQTAEKVGAEDFKFDKLIPMVRAQSHFVPAGTPYQAEVFLAATSSSMKPEIQVGSNSLLVNQDGIGEYKTMASGGAYNPDGMLKKTWTASIKMKKPDGTDTVINVTQEYMVVKPVVQYNSVALKSLYSGCGNKMEVSVPALGAFYNPDFTADGAVIKKLAGQGKIVIVPQAARVNLKVKNQGQLLEDKQFTVKLIPKPDVEVRINNLLVDFTKGVDAKTIRSISIKIIPDQDFKEAQPEDAYYEVVEWNYRAARGRNGIASESLKAPQYVLGSNANRLSANDRIMVEVTKVRRRNYLGQWEMVNMPNRPIIIPLI
jgi:gliding motility-associated protein GldM